MALQSGFVAFVDFLEFALVNLYLATYQFKLSDVDSFIDAVDLGIKSHRDLAFFKRLLFR